MLGPFATASRRTPPVLHCHSPGVAIVARRLRIDVHNNNNDNDNAWQRGPLWPHRMGPMKEQDRWNKSGGLTMGVDSSHCRCCSFFLAPLSANFTVRASLWPSQTNHQIHTTSHTSHSRFNWKLYSYNIVPQKSTFCFLVAHLAHCESRLK